MVTVFEAGESDHTTPGQRPCRGALAQPSHDQASHDQQPRHQEDRQPAGGSRAAQAGHHRARDGARSAGLSIVDHGRARYGGMLSGARHHRQARAFPAHDNPDSHTPPAGPRPPRREYPRSCTSASSAPATGELLRNLIPARIILHNRDHPRSPVMNGACKTEDDDLSAESARGPELMEAGMDTEGSGQELSRRQLLSTAGLAAIAVPLATRRHAPALVRRPDQGGAPGPEQVHVQFGADAATLVAVSWATAAAVSRPRLRLGQASLGHGHQVPAEGRAYTEALTGEIVQTYHVPLTGLHPDTQYVYEVLNDGAAPVTGTFRTGPRGRSRSFRFTSFGDQAIPAAVGLGLGPWTPNAGFIVPAVERLNPLFHLFNGDLSYANVSDAPIATWSSFFNNNTRSAANRPWMPSAGNHENEVGNGPQ